MNKPISVAIVGLAIHVLLVSAALWFGEGTPEWFVHFAERGPFHDYAESEGIDVRSSTPHIFEPRDLQGHDGQAFWMQSRDPFLTDPQVAREVIPRPIYRYQRVLYPTLASPWGIGGADSLFVGMVVTNLLVVTLGGWLTARLAIAGGLRGWVGLSFALNPVVLLSTMLDLSDALAVAGLVGALLAARVARPRFAALGGIVGVLAKEPIGAGLFSLATLGRGMTTRLRVILVLPAALVSLAWAGYVRVRIGGSVSEYLEFTAIPFAGWVETFGDWSLVGNRADQLTALASLALGAAIVSLFVRTRSLEMSAALPYALLLPFVVDSVLFRAENSIRVLGPAYTLLFIELIRTRRAKSSTEGVEQGVT